MLLGNVIWVDFRAKQYDRREKLLNWRDLVERRSRAFSENNEPEAHVVVAWCASTPGVKNL
jgi:hypothetical protein